MDISPPTSPAPSVELSQFDNTQNLHEIPLAQFLARLQTDSKAGLTTTEVNLRLRRDGGNKLTPPRPNYLLKVHTADVARLPLKITHKKQNKIPELKLCFPLIDHWLSLWRVLLASLDCGDRGVHSLGSFLFFFFFFFSSSIKLILDPSPTLFISTEPLGQPPAVANLALAVTLVVIILLQALFTAYQDWSSSRIMKSINKMLPQEAVVIRDGKQSQVAGSTLVKGDVVILTQGNKIPADLRLIEVNLLKIDKSAVTGESLPITGSQEPTDARAFDSCNVGLMGTV